MGFSMKQKMLILQKVLPPNERPVHEVSKEYGISVQTIYKWIKMVKDDTMNLGVPEENIPRTKTDAEKFSLVLEAKALPEDAKGEWLRKNGIHSEHLILWEQELANTMAKKPVDIVAVQKEVQDLKIELKKSNKEKIQLEKALTEMSALYALKKKAEALWGAKEAD